MADVRLYCSSIVLYYDMELNGESSVRNNTSRVSTEEVRRTQQDVKLPVEALRYLPLSALFTKRQGNDSITYRVIFAAKHAAPSASMQPLIAKNSGVAG